LSPLFGSQYSQNYQNEDRIWYHPHFFGTRAYCHSIVRNHHVFEKFYRFVFFDNKNLIPTEFARDLLSVKNKTVKLIDSTVRLFVRVRVRERERERERERKGRQSEVKIEREKE